MEKLLSGVRVLDVSAFSPVKYGTMVLADLGADVIQVERPPSSYPSDVPLLTSTEHPRWLWHSRNKRSLGLDLKAAKGIEVFYELLDTADILVEGFAVGTAERLGIGYDAVRARKPDIIYASVSGFGQHGPYAEIAGHEPNYQAMSGLTATAAERGRDPALLPFPVSDTVASIYSTVAVLAALQQRRLTGRGAYLDISIQDAMLSLFGYNAQYHWRQGVRNFRDVKEFGADPGSGPYRTADGGAVMVSAAEPWVWERLCEFLGLGHLASRFGATGSDADEIRAELRKAFAQRDRDEWWRLNNEHNLGLTPVLDLPEVLSDPHVLGRGIVGTVDHGTLGEIPQVLTPIAVDGRVPTADWLPHELGQHTDHVLTDLGFTADRIAELREQGVVF